MLLPRILLVSRKRRAGEGRGTEYMEGGGVGGCMFRRGSCEERDERGVLH